MKERGFTLIELLVVISIIGLLASVVLSAVNSARSKAKDAAIKQELTQVVTAAAFYYDAYGAYTNAAGNLCPWSATPPTGNLYPIEHALQNISGAASLQTNIAQVGAWNIVTCHNSITPAAFAIEVPLSDSAAGAPHMLCLDSRSTAPTEETANLAANQYTCP